MRKRILFPTLWFYFTLFCNGLKFNTVGAMRILWHFRCDRIIYMHAPCETWFWIRLRAMMILWLSSLEKHLKKQSFLPCSQRVHLIRLTTIIVASEHLIPKIIFVERFKVKSCNNASWLSFIEIDCKSKNSVQNKFYWNVITCAATL